MDARQWELLVAVVRGEKVRPVPTAFIVDSPWLPNWAGRTILDYYTRDEAFLEDNLKAIRTFPGAALIPGFWPEYGMCTEPSAFGAACLWGEDEFPFPKKVLRSPADIEWLERPDPRTHGLLPFVVNRLRHLQPRIEQAGHRVRFAVTRGPFNIASFLMGTGELMLALRTAPDAVHRLLELVTDFLVDWVAWQRDCFPSIDALLVLDDIVGFVGPQDFETFALPSLRRVYDVDVTVKAFHNDAPCKACAPYLAGIGVNLLNFGIQHSLEDMRRWTGGAITLLGNVPPRDVLAAGTPEDVARATAAMLAAVGDPSRLIVSCGGGMPPGAPTANIQALIATVENLTAEQPAAAHS
ncbi:MAG: uroporphyrinogen decarboxylase [Acidobacteria bacterium]|nr:uroporphyrinogen decarboxylase [Acidobacteriota bacterium]